MTQLTDYKIWSASPLKREQKYELLEHQNRRCWWCLRRFNMKRRSTIDHIVPLSHGGPIERIENMVAACVQCNTKRGDTDAGEFARIMGVFAPRITTPEKRGVPCRVEELIRASGGDT